MSSGWSCSNSQVVCTFHPFFSISSPLQTRALLPVCTHIPEDLQTTQAFLSGHLPTSCLWALMVHHTSFFLLRLHSVLGQGPARMGYRKEQALGAHSRLVWLYVSHVTHSKLAPSLSLSPSHPKTGVITLISPTSHSCVRAHCDRGINCWATRKRMIVTVIVRLIPNDCLCFCFPQPLRQPIPFHS